MSCTKLVIVGDRYVSVSLKPKSKKLYIPPFKRNRKEKVYVARLDKGKSSYVDAEVSKLVSKPLVREQKKSVFVPTYYCWCCWSYSTELFFVEERIKACD